MSVRIEQDDRYGEPDAGAVPWDETAALLAAAELYWVTTVSPDGGPHTTPLVAVWHGGAVWFCTGAHEEKAKHLAANPRVGFTTGTNALHGGTDVTVEGRVEQVSDDDRLREVAAVFDEKYGEEWHFEVRDGLFHHGPGAALVFRVPPVVVRAFGKDPYSQTRYRFD